MKNVRFRLNNILPFMLLLFIQVGTTCQNVHEQQELNKHEMFLSVNLQWHVFNVGA